MKGESRPEVVEWLAVHGGLRRIHVTPFTNASREVIGWQNVYVCMDGERRGLSPDEESVLAAYPKTP